MSEIKSLKVIAKETREQLKKEFPNCKFSVRTEYYSMGQALHVTLVKSHVKIFKTAEEIRKNFDLHGWGKYDERDMKNLALDVERQHTQVNDRYVKESPLYTDEGKHILQRATEIANRDNWDHSDPMTDYYDVHFALHLNVGTFERPLEVELDEKATLETFTTEETLTQEKDELLVKAAELQDEILQHRHEANRQLSLLDKKMSEQHEVLCRYQAIVDKLEC